MNDVPFRTGGRKGDRLALRRHVGLRGGDGTQALARVVARGSGKPDAAWHPSSGTGVALRLGASPLGSEAP